MAELTATFCFCEHNTPSETFSNATIAARKKSFRHPRSAITVAGEQKELMRTRGLSSHCGKESPSWKGGKQESAAFDMLQSLPRHVTPAALSPSFFPRKRER